MNYIASATLLFSTFIMASSYAGPPVFGCADVDFVQGTDDHHVQVVAPMKYSPRCLKVKAGARVVIDASSTHPLVEPTLVGRVPTSPVTVNSDHTYSVPGTYTYFCKRHGSPDGTGMTGVLVVTE